MAKLTACAPPLTGSEVPNSANEDAPERETGQLSAYFFSRTECVWTDVSLPAHASNPAPSHKMSAAPTEPVSLATTPGLLKIPLPICIPTTARRLAS